jgi:hypothetical protein
MTRAIFGEALLFFLPFALFALYLLVRRRNPFAWVHWSDQTLWLIITGLVCVILAFLFTGITAERQMGEFEPTRSENGRIVPGQFR